jgi:hypothetical protein
MLTEHITRRMTTALRFLDVNTNAVITTPLTLLAPGAQVVRKPQGDYVILRAPAGNIFEYTVSDPVGQYLPRRQRLPLPRDPDPTHAEQPTSIFQAATLTLYPAPTASPSPGAATIRLTIVDQADQTPVPCALVRVLRTGDNIPLARGLAEWRGRTRGEALVNVPGLPMITWGDGNGDEDDAPVLISEIAATLEVVVDPAFNPTAETPPDPDDLEARRADLPTTTLAIQLSAGRQHRHIIEVDLS